LIDALLSARILIARTDAAGRPTVRLAPQAVLASWPASSAAAQASRDFYRVRAESRRTATLEQYGVPKDRAELGRRPAGGSREARGDFAASCRPADRLCDSLTLSRREGDKRLVAWPPDFLVLALAATGAGVAAFRAQQQAVLAEQRALAERDKATQSFAIDEANGERVGL